MAKFNVKSVQSPTLRKLLLVIFDNAIKIRLYVNKLKFKNKNYKIKEKEKKIQRWGKKNYNGVE